MSPLSNTKVGTKLAGSFAIILLMLCAIVAMAIVRIQSMNHDIALIVDDRYVKVTMVTDIDQAVSVQERVLRDAIVGAKDPQEVKSSLEQYRKSVAEVDEITPKLQKLLVLPKGIALFKEMADKRALYAKASDEAIHLLEEGKADQAGAQVLKVVRPLQNDYAKAIDAIVVFQTELMNKSSAEAKEDGHTAILVTVGVAALAVLVAIGLGVVITRSLTRQLGAEPVEVVAAANAIAAGDLGVAIRTRSGDRDSIMAAMLAMRDRLAQVVGQVRQSSDSIATGSAQIATGNADLSQRTEEQASNLQQTAASMEQLTSTVKANAATAEEANRLAAVASSAATQGGEVVGQVVATMQDIAASSKKISDIIGVIDGIAFQTNILALNAAVEAARAGEQGRGFAVVASEVRTLAQRSAAAAKEIKTLIGASVDKVEVGTRQVDAAGASVGEIVAQVQRVSQLIGEISNATAEQSSGIGQVGDAVGQLDQVTQQNAALVEESAAAAESLRTQAARLADVVSVFRLGAQGA